MFINKSCAYCGRTEGNSTKGHVIPRSLYPNNLPAAKRITVPECVQCKKLWEDAEHQFRNIMLAIWNPNEVPGDNRYENLRRSFTKCDGLRRHNDLMNAIKHVKIDDQNRDMIYPANDNNFNLILRRIIRGLSHFHGVESAISDDRVYCNVMKYAVPPEFQRSFTWNEIYLDFCRYGFVKVNEQNIASFWLIKFSKQVEFFGAVSKLPKDDQE